MSTQTAQTEQQPARSFLQLLLLIAVGFCLLFVYSFTNRLIDRFQVQAEIANWQQLTEQAKDRQIALQAELDYVQSDEHIERIAREELGMTKPGDKVIIRVPMNETELSSKELLSEGGSSIPIQGVSIPISTQQTRSTEQPNWEAWFSWLLPQTNSNP